MADIRLAVTAEEREAVYRFRHGIYVEEMGFFGASADPVSQSLRDELDPTARLLYAEVDGAMAGTIRLNLGTDAPLPEELRAIYQMDRFSDVVPLNRMSVMSRFMVLPDHRGSLLPFEMMVEAGRIHLEAGIQLAFLDCQPHLVNLYRSVGARPYAPPYNDEDGDLLVPLLLIGDREYMEAIRSPVLGFLDMPASGLGALLEPRLAGGDPLHTIEPVADAAAWSSVYATLTSQRHGRASLMHGLDERESQVLLQRNQVIDCRRGDLIVRTGQTARTVFVVLEGTVDVRDHGQVVATMEEGEVFGEVAFLLAVPRISEVVAASDRVRVLALSDKTMRRMIDAEGPVAAKVLLNLSRSLASKLLDRAGGSRTAEGTG